MEDLYQIKLQSISEVEETAVISFDFRRDILDHSLSHEEIKQVSFFLKEGNIKSGSIAK